MVFSSVAAVLTLVACASLLPGSQGGDRADVSGYKVIREIPLPGDTSRWDYQTYDPTTHRLYIAHLGQSQVIAFDTKAQRVIGVVDHVSSVHGLAVAPDRQRLYASATGSDQLAVIDTSTLKVIASVAAGSYPDGIAYVPDAAKIFISDQHGSGDTVIDARSNQRITDIELGGDIGNSQFDPASGLVYVAVGSNNQLAAIDPQTNGVVGRYGLPGCQGAHGLQVDNPAAHRIFVACEGNSTMAVFDLQAKRVAAVFPVGDGPDVLALDPTLARLFVAAENGQLAVFNTGAEEVRKIGQGNGGPNAHSVAVDPETHVVYLPLADLGGHPVLRELQPR